MSKAECETPAETLSPALPTEIEHMAQQLLDAACDRDLTLATAESCTGGLLGSLLTDVEGASHAFERGFIVYTDEAKQQMLGVDPALIAQHGVVSAPVAAAMAEGALARSTADIVLAVTGYASTAPEGEEHGLVHFACRRRGGALHCHDAHFGDIGRGPVRVDSLRIALRMMRAAVDENAPAGTAAALSD